MIKEGTPDFSFIVVENTSNKPNVSSFKYLGSPVGGRLKANGAIWTPLEIHNLMYDSLSILAPSGELVSTSPANSIQYGGGAWTNRGSNPDEYYPSGIWFAPDFPDFLLSKELQTYPTPPQVPKNSITWGVVRMEPGSMSGPPFRGTQEVTPRTREYIGVFGDDTKQYLTENASSQLIRSGRILQFLKVKAQTFDMLIQYNIWSKSNYEVELLTHWFLGYLRNFRGMFREAGVQNMFLWSRVRDDTVNQMKNGYHVRSVLYYFRTEEVMIDAVGPINRINLNIDVDSLVPANKANDYLAYAESQQRILEKWTNTL